MQYIPKDYKRGINVVTGMLEGPWAKHTLQSLLLQKTNVDLVYRIVMRQYAKGGYSVDGKKIRNMIYQRFEERWEPLDGNVLIEVSRINQVVIGEMIDLVKQIRGMKEPEDVCPDYGYKLEGYGINSLKAFDNGTYRPEVIFENSWINQGKQYWVGRQENWYVNPPKDQWIGHKWRNQGRFRDPRAPKHEWNDGMEFPFWRTNVHSRPYSKTTDGLRRSGTDSNRNIQYTRGYDMNDLRNYPTKERNTYRY
jgi:hypothetical protein